MEKKHLLEDDEDILRIGGAVSDSVVDGPGLRDVLFLAGCSHVPHCPSCHNEHLWDSMSGEKVWIKDMDWVLYHYIHGYAGLTISGGEPLDQYEALCKMLQLVNRKRYHFTRFEKDIPARDVVLYTGYTFKEVQEKFPKILYLVDIIVDGRYDSTKPAARWRGSSNQQVWRREADGRWLLSDF